MALFQRVDKLTQPITVFGFTIADLPKGNGASTTSATSLARTMIEPTGVITEEPPSGSVESSTGYLVEAIAGQEIEIEPGTTIEAGVETFTEVAPGVEVEIVGGAVEELESGSSVTIDPGSNVELNPSQEVPALAGSEISVLPQTTAETTPNQFQVEASPGADVEVSPGAELGIEPGSPVELEPGSAATTVTGQTVEVAANQNAELQPGSTVEASSGTSVEAIQGTELPALYVQIEASPGSELGAADGSEVEIAAAALPPGVETSPGTQVPEVAEEVMPGSPLEAETFTDLETVPTSLEMNLESFSIEVAAGSSFGVETGSQAISLTEQFITVGDGSNAGAEAGSTTLLWSGTMVTAQAWWQKVTSSPVSGSQQVSYAQGVGDGSKIGDFGKSIEAQGLGGIGAKLSAAFSSSTGQSHNIQLSASNQEDATHGESGNFDVWQLVIQFKNDSGSSVTARINPTVAPLLLV